MLSSRIPPRKGPDAQCAKFDAVSCFALTWRLQATRSALCHRLNYYCSAAIAARVSCYCGVKMERLPKQNDHLFFLVTTSVCRHAR